jgi:hypothetical protein
MQTQYYCYGCSINKTNFPVVKAYVDELSSARIWQHKLCATLPANVNINYCLSHQSILPYLYYYTYQNQNNSWEPYCVVTFNIVLQDISKFYPPIHVKTDDSISSMNYFLNINVISK